MKPNFKTGLRPCLSVGVLLISLVSYAQSPEPGNVRDPRAYRAVDYRKSSASLPPLLSTVNYTSQNNALAPKDSSWIAYDASGRMSEQTEFRWNEGHWVPYDRFSYNFDGKGFNDQTVYYFWNAASQEFAQLSRYNYKHDDAGNRISMYYEVWSMPDKEYNPGLMEYYSLAPDGQRVMISQQTFNKTSGLWQNNTTEHMTYNDQGKQTLYEVEAWNSNTSLWRNMRRRLTSYDATGKIPTLSEEYIGSGSSNNWDNKARYTNTISGKNIVSQVFESYDPLNAMYSIVSKESMTYNAHGDLSTSTSALYLSSTYQDVSRRSYTYTPDYQPKRIQTMVQDQGKWAVGAGAGLTIYYYKGDKEVGPLRTGNTPGYEADVVIAPVPASNVLNLSLGNVAAGRSTIRIDDVAGRNILRRELAASGSTTMQIDVSQLPAGLYLLTVQQAGGFPVTKRFSIAR